ncbi:hypothetical protein ACOMCU_22450 [Lysinibacillus sp. UGB7]|uniref:hypothetical protein n=1 Tax=Lysinibacillus sp. UGB7 TaxID=3411039 RepID=UPI003B7B74F8
MKKAQLLLLFLIMFLFLSPIATFANTDSNGIDTGYSLGAFECGKPLISEDVDKEIENYKENDANMAEKFLTSQVQNLFHIGPINGMSTLVFGNPYCIWAGKDAKMSADGVFTLDEREKIIEPLLKLFGSAFFLILTLSMLITGLKTMGNSVRGQAMDEFWNDAKMWFVALFLAFFYNDWTNWLFQINAAIVLEIRDLVKASTDNLDNISAMSSISDFIPGLMGSFLIVALGEWVLAGILNVVYLARKVIILLLLVMGFVAIYSLMFAKARAFFGNWFREIVGNVFLQSIHAIVFYAMIMFTTLGASPFFKIGLMIMFIPVSGMISKWLNIGDSSSKLGSALTMVGLGGITSTMMLASQAKSVMYGGSMTSSGGLYNSNSSNSSGGESLANLASSISNDSASTSISSNAAGTNSSLFNMAKDTGSKLGTIVGGGAGVVAGPMGALMGAKLGGAVGGGLVQAGRNMSVGMSNIHSNISQARKFSNENGSGFKALFSRNGNFDSLNARRQTMGNFGESLGVMLAGQRGATLGRSAGFALSGVSRQRLASEMSSSFNMRNSSGNLQPTTFSALSQKYPNADVKWMQTNQGSAFYVNSSEGWKQVGLTGAADSSLNAGQARVMDYKLADPALNYEYQPNGTYKSLSQLSEATVSGAVNTSSVTSASSYANASASSVPSFEEAMKGGHIASPLGTSINGSVSAEAITSNISSSNDSISITQPSVGQTVGESVNMSNTSTSIQSMANVSGMSSTSMSDSVITGNSMGNNSQTSADFTGSDALNSLPPQTVQGSESRNQKMETVGLQGSTSSVMRKSEAYIVNTGESNLALNPKTVEQVASSKAIQHQDAGFNAKKVNPDAYVYHNVSGADTRTTSDKAADSVQSMGKISGTWKEKAQKQSRSERVKKIV